MKLFAPFAVVAAIAAPGHAEAPAALDLKALRDLADAADRAWNARDVDAMAAAYDVGATLRLAGGPEVRGREAIRGYFRTAFASRKDVMRHVTEIEAADLIRPGLALSDATVRVERQRADGGWEVVRRYRNLSLAVHGPDGWRLRAVRAQPLAG
jgi:uncharacterized protein (TIGR02246 family)